MSNNIIPINQARMPAAMRARLEAGTAVNRNFADGVRDAFPLISIRGGKFRVRIEGEERSLVDANEQPLPLNVVLVNGSKQISKVYYADPYQSSDVGPPDCWSLDGVRPDASIAEPINPTCGNCQYNVFGSAAPRGEGKRGGKKCQDARRIAIVMPDFLGRVVEGRPDQPMVFLMRVPATSLKNLKDYAVNLERNGWEPTACITQIYFNSETEYPKLKFRFVNALDDAKYAQAGEIAKSPLVRDMLKAPDFDNTVSNEPIAGPHGIPQRSAQAQAQPQQAAPDPAADIVGGMFKGQADKPAAKEPPQRRAQQQEVKLGPAPLTQAEETVIELPTGELFNTETGEFITREQPKVEMPSMNPDVLPLPDGRFFNRVTNQFVVGPETGAPPATKVAEPPKRQRASRAKPKETPAPQVEAKADEVVDVPQQEATTPAPTVNGNGAEPQIQAASAALDSILKSVLPKR